jgi:hypothetical protein
MDATLLAKDLVLFLAPALPYLIKASEKAAEEVGKKIGGEAMDYAKALWVKLRPKVETRPALLEAVNDTAAAPKDEDAQGQLRMQLKKLLADDAELASELKEILGKASKAGVNVIVSGDHSIGIGGNVTGSTLIAGDKRDGQRRSEKEQE